MPVDGPKSDATDAPETSSEPHHPPVRTRPHLAARSTASRTPLSSSEQNKAEVLARRLQDDLRAFLLALPPAARTAGGLARHLGADRTTCHRLVSAIAAKDAGLRLLTLLPGVRGMRQALAAARAIGVDEATAARAEASIDRFGHLIRELAGSQSRLAGRIAATGLLTHAPGVPRDEFQREQLFRAAAALVGRHCAADLFFFISRPSENGRIATALLRAVLGHEQSEGAVPIPGLPLLTSADTPSRSDGPIVLDEFSTPRSAVLKNPGHDPTDHALFWPEFDARPLPLPHAPPVHRLCALADLPSRSLLIDVYLHRSLARLSVPSVTATMHPPAAAAVGDPSAGRFPAAPKLELLSDFEQAATAVSPRHAELTAHAFERLGCDPEAFVGHRCAVRYPIWRAAYCIGFDYAETPA